MDPTTQGSAQLDANGASVEPQANKDVQADQPPAAPRTIRPEDHKRAVDDMLRFKAQAAEATRRLEALEVDRLKEKEDWKTIAERERKLREEFESKYQKQSGFIQGNQKYSAVHKEAIKAGLRAEAEADLELLPMDGVDLEVTSNGRFLVHGADTFVEELKRKRPHWFKAQGVPTVNTGGAQGGPLDQKLSPAELVKLEKTDPVKYREAVLKQYGARR